MKSVTPRFVHTAGNRYPDHSGTRLGGKAARLIEMSHFLVVPRFYVMTSEAFEHTVSAAGLHELMDDRLGQLSSRGGDSVAEVSRTIQQWLRSVDIPSSVQNELQQVHNTHFADDGVVAVRSSVIGEDTPRCSFAGMHDSVLGVSWHDGYWDAVRRVWSSAYSEQALIYRRQMGVPLEEIRVAVVVQELVDAQNAGVMFTRYPAAGRDDWLVIQSTFGFGTELVGGGLTPDSFYVDRSSLQVVTDLAEKTYQQVLDPRSRRIVRRELAGQQRTGPSLTEDQVRELARAGLSIERHFSDPQDVEFCYDTDGQLFFVQSRPALPSASPTRVVHNRLVWDNSNIVESYPGVTTPMTFSFVCRVYSIVYHCFGEVMGVSPQVLRQHRRTYEQMLGLIRGRIYYNLDSWYRSLRLLPGYHYNRRFMESMMGVKERLDLEDDTEPVSWSRRWLYEFPAFVRMLSRMVWKIVRIHTDVKQFEAHFQRHYAAWARLDFREKTPHQLQRIYREMEDSLLWHWKAPIANDFYVMFFFGLLKELCTKWCDDDTGALQNDLIRGQGGIESAAPAKMMLQLASVAQADPLLRELILSASACDLPDLISDDEAFADFNRLVSAYLEKYGFRCTEELKLEQPSLKERPEQIYQVLRNYLLLDSPDVLDGQAIDQGEKRARREAELRAMNALSGKPWDLARKAFLRWVLKSARAGVRNRENMRFARTRIFGLVRELLRAMGAHLAAEGILDQEDDVFYLTMDEMWDFVNGTAVTTDLRQLAQVRQDEFATYRETLPAPADRFETEGMVYHRNSFQDLRSDGLKMDDPELRGTGCCAGVVTGTARVMTSPMEGSLQPGQVLVTRQLDPGWVPVFPVVSGILVERGSLLSHSAVVAREMGIPTIVGITGLMNRLATGVTIRMDGRRGTVEILSDALDNVECRRLRD